MNHSIKKRLISHPHYAIEILRKFIAQKRWVCPHCGCVGKPHKHHTDQRGIITYQCYHCKKTFNELFRTIFYKSKVPIHQWMLAIIEWEESTGSISSSELSRKLNISYPTAWSMLMKMRTYMNNGLDKNEIFSGIIEADEAWFGRKNNQDIVLGMVERNRRKLKLFIIENVKEETLYPIIEKNVKYGSDFYTDCRITYAITGIYYNHKTTNHSQGEFARNNVHSNTIEQIWGDIKGIIRTIHHGISKKYRHLYLAQYVFKYQFFHITNFFFKTLFTLFLPTYCLY